MNNWNTHLWFQATTPEIIKPAYYYMAEVADCGFHLPGTNKDPPGGEKTPVIIKDFLFLRVVPGGEKSPRDLHRNFMWQGYQCTR
jgi:hypothetical protein